MPLRRQGEGLHRLRAAGDVPYSGGAPRQPKLHIARFPLREESSFISLGLLSHSKPIRWVLNVFRSTIFPEERGERRVRNGGLPALLFPGGQNWDGSAH